MKLDGYIWKYDISLPINKMYEVVDEMKIRLKTMSDDPKCYVVGYGHLGDGMRGEFKNDFLFSVSFYCIS